MANSSSPTVVLVHGAFADASGWTGIIRELQSDGFSVHAPAVPLRGLSSDAKAIGAYVSAVDGPVLLVGHSYGGAVITEASAALDNVVGLVYLAAFGLDIDESILSVQEPFAPPLLATTARPSSYDAPGAAGGPELFIDVAGFRETFCADVPVDLAAVMAATQRPVAAAALGEKCTSAGWRTKPSSYLVSAFDNMISPDAERFMGQRMGGRVETLQASHCGFITQPVKVAAFVLDSLK
jgi:pimeloyl-ACP methyl ester carboxylesterase